jgi:tetratricopeptide (TPR) repeat protein
MNVETLLFFIKENPNMDYNHKWGAFSQLLYHYRDNDDIQNQDKYYLILTKLDPAYFKQHYIEFLFENKLKVDTAITLTDEYISDEKFRNTFWGQYLLAYKLSYLGKVTQAVQSYNNWMENNKHDWETGDDYWSLYFYAKFANYFSVDLERALGYIQIAEKNRNMSEEKLLMAEILYKLGKVEESMEKLKEVQNLTESQNEYAKISRLIKKYSKI